MTQAIIWSADMSVGNSDIDYQHRRLIDTANMVRELSPDSDGEILAAAIDEVIDYIRHHLSFEEGLLIRSGFAGRDQHIDQHNAIRHLVDVIAHDRQAATCAMLVTVMDRLIDHILRVDKDYMGHI